MCTSKRASRHIEGRVLINVKSVFSLLYITLQKVTALLLMVTFCSLTKCEVPLSNQYGLPTNFGSSQGNQGIGGGYPLSQQQQQQQSLTNSYGAPLGGDNSHGNGNGHHGHNNDDNQDYIDNQVSQFFDYVNWFVIVVII